MTAPGTSSVARELTIRGRVQGVFFRAFVREAAQRHGVAGWARNEPDGTVLVRLEGEPADVQEVELACAEGPPGARVEGVDGFDVSPEGLTDFVVA